MVRSCEFRKMARDGLLLGQIERRTKAQDVGIVRTWGAAVLRPYVVANDDSVVGGLIVGGGSRAD